MARSSRWKRAPSITCSSVETRVVEPKAKKSENLLGENTQRKCGKVQIDLGGWVFIF